MAPSSKKKATKRTPAKRASSSAGKKATAKGTKRASAAGKSSRAKKATSTRAASKKSARATSGTAKVRAAKALPAPEPPAPRAISELTRRMVAAAAMACEEKKGTETRLLELDAADAGLTDFFLITSGTNERQTQSIADEVEMRMKREFNTYPNSVEGKRQGEWVLLDYVDFVVHVFLEEKRAFYDIERLRKSARTIDVTQLEHLLADKTVSSRTRAAARKT